jgi:hypothetical protein
LARDWLRFKPLAFPDFERFCSTGFPMGTPIEVCCVYRFRHVRVSLRFSFIVLEHIASRGCDRPSSCVHSAPNRPLGRSCRNGRAYTLLPISLSPRAILPNAAGRHSLKKTVFKSRMSAIPSSGRRGSLSRHAAGDQ